MRRAFLTLLLSSTLLIDSQAQAEVWSNVNEWSPTWETAYSEWVSSSWQTDFFSKKTLDNGQSNPYYGLRVDCADTVYSMRAIFAYENKLPFVVQDPTTVGKTISNKMNRWNTKSDNERIRGFLLFLYDTLSTRSLSNDTYPIAINRTAVRSGALIKTTSKNHHSWTLKEMLPIGVPWLVYNSVVGAGTSLVIQERKSWPNPDWVFEGNFTPAGTAGFRSFRQPSGINIPAWEVPGYSEEQYRIPLSSWVKTVQNKLALRKETDQQLVARLVSAVCEGLISRVPMVKESLVYLAKSPNKCMDYPTYDIYSTPNRDRRIFDDLISLRRSYREILNEDNGSGLSASTKDQLNKIFPAIMKSVKTEISLMNKQTVTSHSLCPISYSQNSRIDLAEFKRRLFLGQISNNPLNNLEYRWGEVAGLSARAKACPSWDAWSPDIGAE